MVQVVGLPVQLVAALVLGPPFSWQAQDCVLVSRARAVAVGVVCGPVQAVSGRCGAVPGWGADRSMSPQAGAGKRKRKGNYRTG